MSLLDSWNSFKSANLAYELLPPHTALLSANPVAIERIGDGGALECYCLSAKQIA